MKLSIRFTLTLWYSLIFVGTALLYSVLTNVIVSHQLHKDPHSMSLDVEQAKTELLQRQLHDGSAEDLISLQDVLNQVRQHDLETIQFNSILLFFVLLALSGIGGYLMAGKVLQPLYYSFNLQKEFIANASHELKTPLTISQLNLEAILHDQTLSRTELENYLRQAISSTTFMNQLIEDLLLLASAEQELTFTPVDLRNLVINATNQLQPLAKQAHKTLTLEHNPTDRFTRAGNVTLLQRAIMNCIENAIKYAKSNILVTLHKTHYHDIITISDDGNGIPAADLPKVTRRFYRVDVSRSKISGGTGLGLAITKTIIERHGGTIKISSQTGQGTTITLTLASFATRSIV